MNERPTQLIEKGVVFGMRLWGVAAVVMASAGILFCIIMFAAALMGPVAERSSYLLQALGFGAASGLLMYLGVRTISTNKRKLQVEIKQLAERRGKLEAWINK